MIRFVYDSPRSLSFFTARTICGTSTVFSAPPANRMYRLFGTVVAIDRMSACRLAEPSSHAAITTRTNPRTLDTIVPAAMIAVAESSRPVPRSGFCAGNVLVAPSSPVTASK